MAAVGNVTGDIASYTAVEKEGVTLHNFPEVDAANLAKKAAIINDYAQSGKRLGAQVMGVTKNSSGVVTKAAIYVAAGSDDVSKWIVLKDIVGTGAADVTPA